MGIALREYQLELKAGIKEAIRSGHRSILVRAPTGSGKTVTAADILAGVEQAGMGGLFLLPRRELVYQSAEKLIRFDVFPGIIMAGVRPDATRRTQLASFDTLHARAIRTEKMPLPPADYVLVDEAHLSAADTRRAILDAYPDAIIIGLTATPARSDGRALGDIYDYLVLSWDEQRMVDEGYLVEQRYFAPSTPDLSSLRKKKNADGDYPEAELGRVMDRPKLIGEIVDNWQRIAPLERTVVFCVTRDHGRHTCEMFVRRGIKAEYVDGETPLHERKQIFKNIENGKTQVLVNVFVATFGLDIPILSCCVIARPTRSIVTYRQMGGRVLRPVYASNFSESDLSDRDMRLMAIACSVKPGCTIIDHSGVVNNHGRLTDFVPWALTYDGNVGDIKRKMEEEKHDPKEIICENCKASFRGARFCPFCGHQMVLHGKPVPVHEAELVEVFPKDGNKANQKTPIAEKQEFYAQALGYAIEKNFHHRFAENKFMEKFKAKPPQEVKDVKPTERREVIHAWLAHMGMKKRFSR